MGLSANLNGVGSIYRLCFIRVPWAFFTRLPLDCQWGDRWEVPPYEAYAGDPYRDSPDQILKIAFDGPLVTPEAGRDGQARSVLEINLESNRDNMPWLSTESYTGEPPVHIVAGTTLESFVQAVDLAGGCVYAPLGWGILPAAQAARRVGMSAPEAAGR
jgi:hypothetical protein